MKIYIASPYTAGDVAQNVRRQIEAAEQLRAAGHLPFWPLHSHYWHEVFPHDWQFWMDMDLEWVAHMDVVLRLPGDSAGADMEVERAAALGLPVFFSVEEFCNYANYCSRLAGHLEHETV